MHLGTILLLILIAILTLLILIRSVQFWAEFMSEMRYLNDEIIRVSDSERAVWKRRRRRLWLSLIPFVRYRP